MPTGSDYVRWFDEIGLEDIPLVGGKNASLGELYRHLRDSGVLVPNGFTLTSAAYRDALTRTAGQERLRALLDKLDPADLERLAECSAAARELVYGATGSRDLHDATAVAYRRLEREYGANVSVAVRSSATAEDLPDASFAGQHESFLAVQGEEAVFDACRRCFASLFLERAIVYRANNGFDHLKVALSVGVMKMVRSDQAASGVIFTLDTESGFRDVVFITGGYGLGENVVQGRIDPDEFYVHKPTFLDGRRAVLRRSLGRKQYAMTLGPGEGAARVQNEATDPALRQQFCIRDREVLTLADYALRIEDHYSARAGHPVPMDVEWAQDGPDGALYVVQARPETVASRKSPTVVETYALHTEAAPIVRGKAVGEKIASGTVRLIRDEADLRDFRPGEVLVAPTTSPDWGPVMKTAAAIVTDHGGRTCHAAIVARELGIPAVVGTETASSVLQPGMQVTASCAGGDAGAVYPGDLPYEVVRTDTSRLPSPRTGIMVNLGNPDLAFRTAQLPNQGVGLARMEFIISEHIGIHPMALLHPERIGESDQLRIRERSIADASPTEFFVRELAEGVGTIAAAFYPKPVIVRLSDFKTNEYAALIGGAAFEPIEANPMLGFRGASRYAHPAYAEGFVLECTALRRVRDEMGLTNLIVMIPFCRRIAEAENVLSEMARNGLRRGTNGLEVYVMCEIPNNVILADGFAKLFDGFSIGSNDLTQLTLGVDRDSEIVAFDFDERDPGMLEMLRLAVAGAHRNGRKVGICGEAPANFPEIAQFLVSLGIDSISVNPSSLVRTITAVSDAEAELDGHRRMRA